MVNVYHVFQNGKAGSCFESNKMACLEKEARRPIRKTTISLFGNRVNQMRGAGGMKFAYANYAETENRDDLSSVYTG
jgi:hypothetical protein